MNVDKIKEFLCTDTGKLVLGCTAGVAALAILLRAAAPQSITVFVNNGSKCKNSTGRSAKKPKDRKRIK